MHKIKLQGEIDSWGFARNLLDYELQQVPEGETVELVVDSLGGDVMEAITISNMLHERGNVTAHIVGFCASAATWLCYGCDKVVINDDCAFLIHKCSSLIDTFGLMNADELETLIAKLKSEKKSNEAIDLIIAQKYAKHSAGKLDINGALKLMKEERWMLPEEALSLGLVDEVCEEHILAKSKNLAARLHVMNNLTNMPKLPEKFAAMREAEDTAEKKTFVQKVKEALTEIFGGSVKMVAAAPTPVPVEDEQPKNIIMNKEFVTVNTLLNVEALEEQDGKISLTVENLKAIEARLAELNNLKTKADDAAAQVTTLTNERDEARQALNAVENNINGISEEIAAMDTLEAKLNAVKTVLENATAVTTEVHAQNEGDGHAEETFQADPVNAVVSRYTNK